MKKNSTVQAFSNEICKEQKLTIGVDLGGFGNQLKTFMRITSLHWNLQLDHTLSATCGAISAYRSERIFCIHLIRQFVR
jgi:hypothetical protein